MYLKDVLCFIASLSNNRNFLGILELIAEFDPFSKEHIRLFDTYSANVFYLSKTICEEFIKLMSNKVLEATKNK